MNNKQKEEAKKRLDEKFAEKRSKEKREKDAAKIIIFIEILFSIFVYTCIAFGWVNL